MSDSELFILQRVCQRFADAWNAHDMKSFSDLFAEDADFVNVVGMRWRGKAAIAAAHAAAHATVFKNSCLIINETEVRFLGTKVAVSRSSWTLKDHVNPDGQPQSERKGFLTHVLEMQNGEWLILVSQNTDTVLP